VAGFWSAFWGALAVSCVSMALSVMVSDRTPPAASYRI
jgi:uncharacterized membrane protein YvlD (DUF360 family)